MAGYSGKSLTAKLGVTAGARVSVLHAPDHFEALLDPLPADVVLASDPSPTARIVILFATAARTLANEFQAAAERLPSGGMIWVAWPKRASGVATDLTETLVRRVGLMTGLVDVKVCAIDDVWSGLKFVRRKVSA